jgi:hypothetical protein
MNAQAKVFTLVAVVLGMVMFLSIECFAQANAETADTNQKYKDEELTLEAEGVVTGLSPNFIALQIGKEDKTGIAVEAAFEVDKNVQMVHKKSFKEINLGDTVKVVYKQKSKVYENGRKTSVRAPVSIVFLRSAPKKIDDEGTLRTKTEKEQAVSAEAAAPIPLKGLKKGD